MNKRQLTSLKVFAGALILTMLFPPFAIFGTGGSKLGRGFHFILWSKARDYNFSIDVALLLTEILAETLIAAAVFAILRDTDG